MKSIKGAVGMNIIVDIFSCYYDDYTPRHTQDTWDSYKLGVGIFTMEGFE